jgi:sugar lactone lactonase YvrE/ABC-type molybdate transport system substrate-binding protein
MTARTPRRRSAVALALGLALCSVVAARAGELKVMTSGAFTAPYLALFPRFEQDTHDKVVTLTTTMGTGTESIPSRIGSGERVDVVIVAAAALDEMIRDGTVVAGSRVDLARSEIGVAVRSGAAMPDIGTVAGLTRTLLEAKSIAYSASVSGDYISNELFKRLGIHDQVAGKSRRIERERVGAVVARGEADLGFQQISELLPVPGIQFVGPLPADVQRSTVFAAGVAARAANPEGARAFIRFLASPAAADAIRKSGLEPMTGAVARTQGSEPQPEVATTVAFTEGPTTDREGNVYFTDIINQRILKLGADGVLSTYRERSNAANGLLVDPQGRLIACEGASFERPGVKVSGTPRVTRTDLKTGVVEVLADRFEGKPLVGPNDVTIDGKGRLYFTELNGAAVYRIDAPGQVSRILAAPDVRSPNGIQISPDDRFLYLVEANTAKDGPRLIRKYDLQPDGTVRNMRVHYDFSPGRSADGMSIDTEGNLYASAGMNQLRGTAETLDTKTGVYVISPEGRLLKFLPIPEDFITNNAFGGPDMKTLYVTAGKTLYRLRTDIAGLPR